MRLVEIDRDNVGAAVKVEVAPDQQKFVAPVVNSLAEAFAHGSPPAWPRLIMDGDEAVGFVMAAFDPESEIDFFRAGVWRLNIAAGQQGKGYGRFAVEQVAEEARRRGFDRITVLWETGDGGPEQFYLKLGFVPTGQVFHGEVVAELALS